MKTLKELKPALLADPATRREYEALGVEFELAQALIKARTGAGLSQAEIARRMGTTQSVIARLESGRRPPSIRTLEKFAQAVGGRLHLTIEPA